MKIFRYLEQQYQRLEQYLIQIKTEPQIKEKCDRYGKSYWQIYDPVSGHSTLLGSETEVRIWLENYFRAILNKG